jgi:hypothetical protein
MSYAQIHTQALRHPKVRGLSSSAFRVWVAALCYCQDHLTDGAVTHQALKCLGWPVPPKLQQELVAAGLWHEAADGYQVHDYADWNQTRADVLQKRALAKQRWERHQQRQRVDQRVSNVQPTEPIRSNTNTIKRNSSTTTSHNGAPPTGRVPGKTPHQPNTRGARACPHEPPCANYRACRDKALEDAKALVGGAA